MHMATDLVNFKRVKSLPTQIETTEKKGSQSLSRQSLSVVKGETVGRPWEK